MNGMTEFTQGAIFTAIAHTSTPAGPIRKDTPLQYQEFVTLTSKTNMCNLYLGRVPKDDAERAALNDKLFNAVQKNAPLVVDMVTIARSRADRI